MAAPLPSLRACALACLLALVVLVGAGLMESGRSLWQDEAMLLANLGMAPWRYFQALPFYDQAAPPLAMLLLDGVHRLAIGTPQAMRLLLLALNTTLLAGLSLAAYRRADRHVLLAIAAAAVSVIVVRYCVEVKQYVFEFHATLIFLVALRWHPTRPARLMALAGVLSFLSFSVMLVVGVASFDAILFRLRGAMRRRWLLALTVYTLGWVACYVAMFRPAIALQTSNYAIAYNRLPLVAYARDPLLLWPQIGSAIGAQTVIAIATGLLGIAVVTVLRPRAMGAALRSALRRPGSHGWQPLRVTVGLFAFIAVLWMANLYPVSSSRQLLFTLPLGALLLSQLVIATSRAGASRTLASLLIAAMLVPSAIYVVRRECQGRADFEDTRGLYAFVRMHRSALILADFQFEPTLRQYLARDPDPPPRIGARMRPESAPMQTLPQALAALQADAPIPQHIHLPLSMGNAVRDYARWLFRQAQGQGEVIFAAAQFDPHYEPVILDEARRHGCAGGAAYRSRLVVAFRFACTPRLK